MKGMGRQYGGKAWVGMKNERFARIPAIRRRRPDFMSENDHLIDLFALEWNFARLK